jgi:hypothetical protein
VIIAYREDIRCLQELVAANSKVESNIGVGCGILTNKALAITH